MNTLTRGRAIVAAGLIFCVGGALADGRIEGRVVAVDETTNLEGATVRIASLDRRATTLRDGRFSFGRVPAGSYDLEISYLGTDPSVSKITVPDDGVARITVVLGDPLEEIIVRGFRFRNTSALNQQRSSDTVVSVVSADAIGALPDGNVAEAMQRVAGVFLERDQGEGRYVGIRGIDPNLNTTTINGVFVPAPDSGARSVALDVIPSDLLERLEISKTFTPDMDGSAIGGIVNVRSMSAFDREGRSLTLSTEGSHNGLVDKFSPKLAGSFSDVFSIGEGSDNFGVAFGASWFDRDFGSDNIETDGGWPSDIETATGAEFKGAEEIEQRSYDVNRERLGVALNFDYRYDGGMFYFRNLFSEFSDQEYRTRNEWKFDDGEAISGNNTSAAWTDATVEKSMKDRLEEQNIRSVLLGGESWLDTWTIEYSAGYSEGEEKEPARLDTEFELEGLDLAYNSVGEQPDLVPDPAMSDASNFGIKEWVFLDGVAEDTTINGKLDFTKSIFSNAYNGDLKFGVAVRTREKSYDAETFVYEGPDGLNAQQFANAGPRYGIGTFGPGLSAGAIRSYFDQNRGSLDIDSDGSLVESLVGDYEMNEDVSAAYLMSHFERSGLRVVYGVRYEDTEFDATGLRIAVDDVSGSGDPEARAASFTKSYDNLLPSINVRLERGDFVWRAAATQTIGRPNFGDLSPGGEIEFETDDGENVLSAEVGNPLLEPVEATNIDLGVAWYPGGASVFSAGVFYKELDNFIVVADVADIVDLSQFVGNAVVDDAEVIQPINGDTADLFGVELSFLTQFENGVFLSGNGTFVDSEATYPERDTKTDLPRTPGTVINGAVGWENDKYTLRLAATYRDKALQGFEELDDPDFDVYQDEHLQLDLSAKWNITDDLQLSFAAVNLTDEPFYTYFGNRSYNAQYEDYGRTFSVGLRYAPY